MAKEMNAAQRYLVSTIHGEFLPGGLREGDHYAEIDAIVRQPSRLTPGDRLFTFLWKEFDDETTLEGCKEAMGLLFADLAEIGAGLNEIAEEPVLVAKI
jgi:hypothetical protein